MAKKSLEEKIVQSSIDAMAYNPLLTALRENDKKNLFQTNAVSYFHKTGYPLFDYYFGSIMNVHDEVGKIVKQVPRVGQAAGTFNLIVGTSGSGKTTWASQIAANIIRYIPSANVIHCDCEQRYDISRAENVTQLPISDFGENGRYILKSGTITLEEIQEIVVRLYVTKMKMKDQLMIDTDDVDEFGKPVKILSPTVLIIDSITTVLSEMFSVNDTKKASDAEKLRSNTEGARDAKTLKGFFKDILPLCKEANIIIYAINHINTNMSMNAFIGPTKNQNFLKQDEIIPGGKTMIFYPFNIIKMTAQTGSSDYFYEDTDGFSGYRVMVEPIKSSSNQSGNDSKGISFDMVFSYKHGFDSLRSLTMYGREKGIIEGNRSRLKFRSDDSFTFTLKGIDKEKEEKPIWENIKKFIIPELETHLSFIEPGRADFDKRAMDY